MTRTEPATPRTTVPLCYFEAGPLVLLTLEAASNPQPAHRAAAFNPDAFPNSETLAGAALRLPRPAPSGGELHYPSFHDPAALYLHSQTPHHTPPAP